MTCCKCMTCRGKNSAIATPTTSVAAVTSATMLLTWATGQDARRALVLALASIESVQTAAPVSVDKVDPR